MSNKPNQLLQRYKYPLWLLAVIFVVLVFNVFFGVALNKGVGSTTIEKNTFQQVSGPAVSYWNEVKPLLERRCVVCHGCYDAPCQLKLSAYEGVQRGGHKDKVYDGKRLLAANMMRLFEDGHSISDWREKGFYSVLQPQNQTAHSVEPGLMSRMLTLKQRHPLPDGELLPDSFDLSLRRDQQCPKPDEFESFSKDYPLWGMPYGLPALNDSEHQILTTWLAQGAPYQAPAALPSYYREEIDRWERFLNGNSLKQQLMSRYIYEHLFLADVYFDDSFHDQGADVTQASPRHFFRLRRSRTPPGKPIDIIATRRPYDDPGVKRVYYRIEPIKTTVLDKTHQIYVLNNQRMRRYTQLFLTPAYEVTQLPDYEPSIASNPFKAFQAIPQRSRYKFLLDEARFTIMGFIKGPVCRGQVALNVINDHFWVTFMAPDHPVQKSYETLLQQEANNLSLPAEAESNSIPLMTWVRYAALQMEYLQARHDHLDDEFFQSKPATLDLIWDGNGDNTNAALTIFRHFDSASVVKGFVGEEPKTLWLIDYPLLERIHYLLVAGFDVYGNVGHQLNTRLYMDFLRMEGENNFLMLLPKREREKVWDHWYREISQPVKNFAKDKIYFLERKTHINYKTDKPKQELIAMLEKQLAPALDHRYDLDSSDPKSLKRLSSLKGEALLGLPQVSFLMVETKQGASKYYTLLHNNAHSNISHFLLEDNRRLPEEDSLTVVKGFIGSYPNVFLKVHENDLDQFVDSIAALKSELDYRRLISTYGIRRTNPDFWQYSDDIYKAYQSIEPIDSGLFDFNRLENR